jgi:hypothetical protein
MQFEKAKIIITGVVSNAIMLNLVDAVKDGLLPELLQVLDKMENLDELLEANRNRQNECIEMIEALNDAQEILSEFQFYF